MNVYLPVLSLFCRILVLFLPVLDMICHCAPRARFISYASRPYAFTSSHVEDWTFRGGAVGIFVESGLLLFHVPSVLFIVLPYALCFGRILHSCTGILAVITMLPYYRVRIAEIALNTRNGMM